MIGKCRPDVILVEKAVSRNVNEYVQKQGVTLVSDMNIHRLERIALCTGSPIISLQDVRTKTNLIKQCESVNFKKIVEEHNLTVEDGRRSPKTFLFLEGFPKPMGCTVCLLLFPYFYVIFPLSALQFQLCVFLLHKIFFDVYMLLPPFWFKRPTCIAR